jgi:hypothetical protein
VNRFHLAHKRDERVALDVFEIHSDRARGDGVARGLNGIAVSGFDIGSDRDIDGACDSLNQKQHFAPGNLLAVGIAENGRNARAAGGDGGESFRFDDARADGIAHVGEDENVGARVKGAQPFGLLSLFHLIHWFSFS